MNFLYILWNKKTSLCSAHSGTGLLVYVFECECVDWLSVRVCVCVRMLFPKHPFTLLEKLFQEFTSLGHRARSNQSHAASLGAVLLSPRQAAAFLSTF